VFQPWKYRAQPVALTWTPFEEIEEADSFAGLSGGTSDGPIPIDKNTTTVQAAEEENPDLASLGKDLLAGYANWKGGQADFDPQDDPLHYIWYDAPELILGAILAGGVAYKGYRG